MQGAKSALITYVQFKFHVIDLKGNYSHGWIASADTSVIIFSSIFNTSSTFYTCFPVVRSNWGRLLRLAHLATFFRRLILSTSHVFFHQPTVLKNLRHFSSGGDICSIVKWEISWPLWIFLSFTLFQNQENKKREFATKFPETCWNICTCRCRFPAHPRQLPISGRPEKRDQISDITMSLEARLNVICMSSHWR